MSTPAIMSIIFVLLFTINSELTYCSQSLDSMNVLPHNMAFRLIILLCNLFSLIGFIWYFGWWGITLFILYFFRLVHNTIGWLLTSLATIMRLKATTFIINRVNKILFMYPYFMLVYIVFIIISLFIVDIGRCFIYISANIKIIIAVCLIGAMLKAFYTNRKQGKLDRQLYGVDFL